MSGSDWAERVAAELVPLRRKHLVVDDDNWYSCPMSEECNRDSYTGEPACRCGADAYNAKLDEIAARIGRGVEAALKAHTSAAYWPMHREGEPAAAAARAFEEAVT